MEDIYFVTQAISPETVHVAVSERSDPAVIATTRRHALYQGANRDRAREVAGNLERGVQQ